MRRFLRLPAALTAAAVALFGLAVPEPALAVPGAGARGYDVSWPQCGESLPGGADFGIVGVNGGKPYEVNPCFPEQYQWASTQTGQAAFYMNTANPGTASKVVDWYAQKSPNPACSGADEAACAYNYGYNAAKHAFEHAQQVTSAAGKHMWWLDVETSNSWSGDTSLNVADILGSIAYLQSRGVPVGAYSTRYQWGRITGGVSLPGIPSWVAGARNAGEAPEYCSESFTGAPVLLVQWVDHDLDHDYACSALPEVTSPAPGPAPNALEQLLADLLRLDLGAVLKDLGF